MKCPHCQREMNRGVAHDERYLTQYECRPCNVYVPVKR